jgi:hypothetical protein
VLVLLLLQLGCHVAPAQSAPAPTAATTKQAASAVPPEQPAESETTCGVEPKRLRGFERAAAACWANAALPPAALSYQPFSTAGVQRVAAATWADAQRLVQQATGQIHVTLSGSLTADTPLLISSRDSLVLVSGPADIACDDSQGSSAFVIQR